MTPRQHTERPGNDTKIRILDAAEELFLDQGYDALSLRQITTRAAVNLAAVNYHFGNKEALVHAMLARRLDRLNADRLKLLDHFETNLGAELTCEHVLGAMFLPAMRLSRDPRTSGRGFLRLLGRAYGDVSPCVRGFLRAHYASVAERFFSAFTRALPGLEPDELRWRLQFIMSALSGLLANANGAHVLAGFPDARPADDMEMIARLAALMVAALKAPRPDPAQTAAFCAVIGDAGTSPGPTRPSSRSDTERPATTSRPVVGSTDLRSLRCPPGCH